MIYAYDYYNEHKYIKYDRRVNYKNLLLKTSTKDGNCVHCDSEGIQRIKNFLKRKAQYKCNNFYRVKTGFYWYAVTLHESSFHVKILGLLP